MLYFFLLFIYRCLQNYVKLFVQVRGKKTYRSMFTITTLKMKFTTRKKMFTPRNVKLAVMKFSTRKCEFVLVVEEMVPDGE